MKAITERLSRAMNAKDAKMNHTMYPLSPLAGRGQGEGGHARRTTRSGSPSPQPSPLVEGRGSLFALTAIAAALLFTAPSAQAQCDAADPGAASGTVTCVSSTTAGNYAFTSDGDLTVDITGSAATNAGAGGVSLTADNAGDNLTVNRTGGAISGNGNTAPRVIDVLSQDGNISITATANVNGNSANTVYGIHAESLGAGNISIVRNSGNIATTGALNIAAMRAVSNGGNISIVTPGTNANQGGEYGVIAATSGSGTLSFTGAGTASAARGVAGLDFTTGTGLMTVNVIGGTSGNSGTGIGIRTHSAGNAVLNLQSGNVSGLGGVIELNMNGGATTINGTGGQLTAGGSGMFQPEGRTMLRALGNGNITVNQNAAAWRGSIDLSGHSGNLTYNIGATNSPATWTTAGLNTFASGTSTLTVAAGSSLVMGVRGGGAALQAQDTTLDFVGSGTQLFRNQGAVYIGFATGAGGTSPVSYTATLDGLTRFENSGLIVMGQFHRSNSTPPTADAGSDTFLSSVLRIRDSEFVASGNSTIAMDVLLSGTPQSACMHLASGRLPAADCVDLQGTTVSGVTRILVKQQAEGDRGYYNPEGIMLVDVAGGEVLPGAFILDPNSRDYNPAFGGVIDKGLFFYPLLLDEETQQFKLYGLPTANAFQPLYVVNAAQQAWRTATTAWSERESELRGSERGTGFGGGLWFRGASDNGKRSATDVTVGAGQSLAWNNDHDVSTWSATFGVDLISYQENQTSLSGGVMLGYVHGSLDYADTPNTARLDGMSAGLYGSYVMGAFYVDAALNTTWMNMDTDIPQLNLDPAGTLVSTNLNSIGAQVEAGWRWRSGQASLEPMVLLDYIKTSVDDLRILPGDPERTPFIAKFDDQTSSRGGLGLRASLENRPDAAVRTTVTLSGRYMREFDGDTAFTIPGETDLVLTQPFDGSFSEIGLGLALANPAGSVSGFLNTNMKFGEGYESQGFSAGFRYQW